MKITKVHIENFKRFVPPGLDISLRRAGDQGRVSEQFLLLGDNGTGKTTVLQAIALTLSLAAKQTRTVNDLRWVGWAGDRYYAKGDPIVEVSVEFSPEEIEATHRINRRWWDTFGKSTGGYIEPGKDEKITLRLRGPTVEVAGGNSAGLLQFQGRTNAAALTNRGDREARDLFQRLPGLFWFDQFRNVSMIGEFKGYGRALGEDVLSARTPPPDRHPEGMAPHSTERSGWDSPRPLGPARPIVRSGLSWQALRRL